MKRMMTGKPIIVLAMALAFSGLQCAAWCTVSACDLTQLSETASHNAPPCHRQHTDSSKNTPAAPCSHGMVIANAASFSAMQAPVAPLVAILPVQPETNPRVLVSGNESAVSSSLPPGGGGPSSAVLRI